MLPELQKKDVDTKEQLLRSGVIMPDPDSVYIGQEVDWQRISGKGMILYPGVRIFGEQTFIARGAQIGGEGPVTIDNCYIGPSVELKAGYFSNAVFLEKAVCGSGAHIRKGTILEERASIAHTVGLKQTILFPYVALGSLINFCDCLMAGGSDAHNHSEVGSSYIHFNFTANQDKATASLIGDVARGVMLNQSPIFLGGQGGLVGPCRIAYGTVLAAGSICRKDQPRENHIVFEGTIPRGSMPFSPGTFRNIKRIVFNNLNYIANLTALYQWYRYIRQLFVADGFPQPLLDGLQKTLKSGLIERFHQLDGLRGKIDATGASGKVQETFCQHWPDIQGELVDTEVFEGSPDLLSSFCALIENQISEQGRSYLSVIKGLNSSQTASGTQWLESVIEQFMARAKQDLSI